MRQEKLLSTSLTLFLIICSTSVHAQTKLRKLPKTVYSAGASGCVRLGQNARMLVVEDSYDPSASDEKAGVYFVRLTNTTNTTYMFATEAACKTFLAANPPDSGPIFPQGDDLKKWVDEFFRQDKLAPYWLSAKASERDAIHAETARLFGKPKDAVKKEIKRHLEIVTKAMQRLGEPDAVFRAETGSALRSRVWGLLYEMRFGENLREALDR